MACNDLNMVAAFVGSAVEVRQRTLERQQKKEAKLDAFLETTRARVGKDKDPSLRAGTLKSKGAAGATEDHAVVSAGKSFQRICLLFPVRSLHMLLTFAPCYSD